MKKLSVLLLALLMMLTACSTKVQDSPFGSFILPRGFKEVETGDNNYAIYSDQNSNGEYTGKVIMAYYSFKDEFDSFEDYIAYVKDEGIKEYAAAITDVGQSFPNQRDIKMDGLSGYKTLIIGDDQFKLEFIDLLITKEDGEEGVLEIILDYSGKEYPDLAEHFMKDYKKPKSE